jgi:hypothetical protein
MFRCVESANSGDSLPLTEAFIERANRRRRRLYEVLILLSGVVGIVALFLTINAYRLLTQDPTQTDEVIWARAVALATGAVSTVAALGASAYGFIGSIRLSYRFGG